MKKPFLILICLSVVLIQTIRSRNLHTHMPVQTTRFNHAVPAQKLIQVAKQPSPEATAFMESLTGAQARPLMTLGDLKTRQIIVEYLLQLPKIRKESEIMPVKVATVWSGEIARKAQADLLHMHKIYIQESDLSFLMQVIKQVQKFLLKRTCASYDEICQYMLDGNIITDQRIVGYFLKEIKTSSTQIVPAQFAPKAVADLARIHQITIDESQVPSLVGVIDKLQKLYLEKSVADFIKKYCAKPSFSPARQYFENPRVLEEFEKQLGRSLTTSERKFFYDAFETMTIDECKKLEQKEKKRKTSKPDRYYHAKLGYVGIVAGVLLCLGAKALLS